MQRCPYGDGGSCGDEREGEKEGKKGRKEGWRGERERGTAAGMTYIGEKDTGYGRKKGGGGGGAGGRGRGEECRRGRMRRNAGCGWSEVEGGGVGGDRNEGGYVCREKKRDRKEHRRNEVSRNVRKGRWVA